MSPTFDDFLSRKGRFSVEVSVRERTLPGYASLILWGATSPPLLHLVTLTLMKRRSGGPC